MPKYECIEDNEKFIIEAKDMAEAKEGAAMYNGSVIRQLPEKKEKKNAEV